MTNPQILQNVVSAESTLISVHERNAILNNTEREFNTSKLAFWVSSELNTNCIRYFIHINPSAKRRVALAKVGVNHTQKIHVATQQINSDTTLWFDTHKLFNLAKDGKRLVEFSVVQRAIKSYTSRYEFIEVARAWLPNAHKTLIQIDTSEVLTLEEFESEGYDNSRIVRYLPAIVGNGRPYSKPTESSSRKRYESRQTNRVTKGDRKRLVKSVEVR